ncbi:hypothetical protein F5883DRAFT_638240 [Diaporthe sp. PMI_573]|nr:hypothetical protein F5883DRAFT_638240 [Diaporthaceae sp. PMI_573]
MSDADKEPQGPFNPFIRFKNHVNARIGTGVSVFTGTNDDRDKPAVAGDTQYHDSTHTAGSLKQQSPMINYWDDWCYVDPYSPHNLRHLPQPTPMDLPLGVDPADFGFPEAFEDLMSASNPFRGQLMDLGMRAGLKRTAAGGPVKPETPSAWVRRLYGDALLPPPFIWEQPRLAGGFPSMEEVMGQDVAEMMRSVQKFAKDSMEALSGVRSEDNESGSRNVRANGDARHASAGEEDQPATEEDLYEMIQSASASPDKSLDDFMKAKARQALPPAEHPARDNPPVSETVEHDPSGGKTIRTSSEHVDMFGFIHSRTEVRRLNAKGETVDYDTRYSVRSGPQGDRPPQQEYRPRSDAPVSVLMTPEQYAAFIGKSSDEQLEAFRATTAAADESGLDPENLALKKQQMQLILQEQRRRTESRNPRANTALWQYEQELILQDQRRRAELRDPRPGNSHLEDYQRQLMLLEEQNRKRLAMIQPFAPADEAASGGETATGGEEHKSQRYQEGLERLEEQGRERVKRAREEAAAARPPSDKPQGSTDSERSGWFWR